jgi:hypothetical protein
LTGTRRSGPIIVSVGFGVFCIPALLFGVRNLAWWTVIQFFGTLHLDYPYLESGLFFTTVGLLQILCIRYGAWRTGKWRLLLPLCVVACLWSMVAIPNILPYDMKTGEGAWALAHALDSFGNAHRQFPDSEATLASAQMLSPYYEYGHQLPFNYKVISDARGPFLDDAGNQPAKIFYAISADLQDVWITATRLDSNHAVGHRVQFVPLGPGREPRALHLRVGQWIVN